MELYIAQTSVCVDEQYAQEEYGDWSAQWEFSVDGVYLSKPKDVESDRIETGVQHKEGDTVYVLSMVYSDGDSFGCAEGKGEVLWVFSSLPLAKEAEKRVQFACDFHGDWRRDRKEQQILFTADNGSTVTMGNPAFDYFSRVSCIKLEPFVVKV